MNGKILRVDFPITDDVAEELRELLEEDHGEYMHKVSDLVSFGDLDGLLDISGAEVVETGEEDEA